MNRFEGRNALVTGAASGIGAATTVRLAAEGATVACVDVDVDGLLHTVVSIAAGGGRAADYPCDLLERETVPEIVARIAADLGGLDAV